MKKRFLSILLALGILLTFPINVLAAAPSDMTDISGHWAERTIRWAMEQGLFSGTSETTFSPNATMTRGMFVTVLAKIADVNASDYRDWYLDDLFSDVDASAYYAPYVNWAVRTGISTGIGGGKFGPDLPVTREQIAVFLVGFTSTYNYELVGTGNSIDSFTDSDTVSDYASASVDTMRALGIISGRPSGNGTYRFDPKANATRAECAAMFRSTMQAMRPYTERTLVDPETLTLTPGTAKLYPGQSMRLVTTVLPEDSSNKTITWVSSDPKIVSVESGGKITAHAVGTADVYAYTWNGLSQHTVVTVSQGFAYTLSSQSYADKSIQIFGEVVSDPRYVYESAAEAESHMVEIAVQCWDFADGINSEKVTVTRYLTVHQNIASTVEAIFDEIYKGKEQFPIHEVGCYRWEPGSEHMPGVAIDINPDSNYFCYLDGTAIVGTHWDPETDPYSIPIGGDVETAFGNHGFSRGFWSTKSDYMHFSLFGT